MIQRSTLTTVFLITTLIGSLSFLRRWFSKLADDVDQRVLPLAVDEFTAAYAAGLLLLPVILLARRRPPWVLRHLPLYLLVAAAYCISHTLAMFFSRTLMYPLLNLGSYNYGNLGYRFVMEAPVQLLALVVLIIGLYMLAQVERAREAEKLRGMLAESQLETLRLKLAPHFLFNALNTISSVVYDSPAKADELIGRLGRMLRTLLTPAADQHASLNQELTLIQEYVEIQKARFGERLQVRFDSPPDNGDYRIPFMILQPLVENAMKHGCDNNGDVSVTIRSSIQQDLLRLDVLDKGPGPVPARSITGVGLKNTRERLHALYGDRATLTLNAREGGGSIARICLPAST